MPSGPPICALRARARPTSDSGSSGWPTPKAQEDGRTLEQYEAGRVRGYLKRQGKTSGGKSSAQGTLSIAVQLVPTGWSTPTTVDAKGRAYTYGQGDHERPCLTLVGQAQMAGWNTPRATDGSNGGPNQAGGALSHDANLAGWATPAARDWRSDQGQKSDQEQYGTKGRPLPRQILGLTPSSSSAETAKPVGSRLNPHFSRWLQGFPDAWASCVPTATRSSRPLRQSSSAPISIVLDK